jgi:hypothetical protein
MFGNSSKIKFPLLIQIPSVILWAYADVSVLNSCFTDILHINYICLISNEN